MFRGSDIIDLPVISLKSGKRLCNVRSLVIDIDNKKVAALLCKEAIVGKSVEFIAYKSILRLDQNGVTIYDGSLIKKINLNKIALKVLKYEDVIGKYILGAEKELLGIITDIFINALNGTIEYFEVSEGYFDDFLNGRKLIACFEKGSIIDKKQNCIIMPRDHEYHYRIR